MRETFFLQLELREASAEEGISDDRKPGAFNDDVSDRSIWKDATEHDVASLARPQVLSNTSNASLAI